MRLVYTELPPLWGRVGVGDNWCLGVYKFKSWGKIYFIEVDWSQHYSKQVLRRERVMRKHNDSERKSTGLPVTAI